MSKFTSASDLEVKYTRQQVIDALEEYIMEKINEKVAKGENELYCSQVINVNKDTGDMVREYRYNWESNKAKSFSINDLPEVKEDLKNAGYKLKTKCHATMSGRVLEDVTIFW